VCFFIVGEKRIVLEQEAEVSFVARRMRDPVLASFIWSKFSLQ